MEAEEKRIKVEEETEGGRGRSRLYSHFRAIGRVTAPIPINVYYPGGFAAIAASIGKSFHIYDAETLNLLFVGREQEQELLCIACKGEFTLSATKDLLSLYNRARLQCQTMIDLVGQSVLAMEIIGEMAIVLFSTHLCCYRLVDLEFLHAIEFVAGLKAVNFIHPLTYLNKVLVAFNDGTMQLWNINTRKCIHQFASLGESITCMAQAPAVDHVAVGLEDGTTWMINLRQDKRLFSFKQPSKPLSLSFRTGNEAEALLAVGLASGIVTVWDLDRHRLHSTWEAHDGPVHSSIFIQNQPILITSGTDNALREWTLEGSHVRLLKSRTGHAKPPRRVRYYGEEGLYILSASRDRSFRLLSLVKDSQHSELSQGPVESMARRRQRRMEELKFDPIVSFDSFVIKDLKWDNVISAHEKSCIARTWRADHRKVGMHLLRTQDGSFVSTVAMSACGNFALLGTAKGSIDVFNVQSGIYRKHFGGPPSPVVGIAINSCNQTIVSAHQDGHIRLLDMVTGGIKHECKGETSICCFAFHPDSELLAVAMGDHRILLYDMQNQQLVRLFEGHQEAITDLIFSQDCRWLLSSSRDCTVRTWDLATGLQLDLLHLQAVPLSITLSPTMDFLALVMEDDVGVHLWTNMSMYTTVAIEPPQSNPAIVSSSGKEEQLADGLLSLTLEPRNKVTTLYHLDSIKARNKPTLPPKPVEKAPFFLDALLLSGEGGKSKNKNRKRDKEGEGKVVSSLQDPSIESKEDGTSSCKIIADVNLHRLLHSTGPVDNEAIFAFLREMSPSEVDFEIKSIFITNQGDLLPLQNLLVALTRRIECQMDFDLAITILNLLLKSHRDSLQTYSAYFAPILAEARQALQTRWTNLEMLFHRSLCLATFAREH